MYISSGEGKYGVEPDIFEVEKIMRAKPDIVTAGKEFRFKPSFMSLIRKDVIIDIGWRIGGRYEYNSSGGGGKNFLLSPKRGVCSITIIIKDGYNNDAIQNEPGDWCLQRMKPFEYKY